MGWKYDEINNIFSPVHAAYTLRIGGFLTAVYASCICNEINNMSSMIDIQILTCICEVLFNTVSAHKFVVNELNH